MESALQCGHWSWRQAKEFLWKLTLNNPRMLPGRLDSCWANFYLNEHKYLLEGNLGSPKHQAIINWTSLEKFFLPWVPYSCQFHLYRTKHVGNTLQVSVWEDLVFGRTCWIPSLSAWQNGTWHQHQSRGMRSLRPWTHLAVPEYSLWMMADTLPKILAYISARNDK